LHRSTSSPNDALSTKERKRDGGAAAGADARRAADALSTKDRAADARAASIATRDRASRMVWTSDE
jgi:hypothetical protein